MKGVFIIKKKVVTVLLTLLLTCSAAVGMSTAASAATSLPKEIYVTQQQSDTCTLASTTMMIRSRLYLSGSKTWESATESTVASTAWGYAGLWWSFKYEANGDTVQVGHESVSGVSASTLKKMLDEHPEGFVLYSANSPHAVFLTDYEGDTFYCADPAEAYGGGTRIKLADSLLGQQFGGQAAVLSNTTDFWYITSYSVAGETGSSSLDTTAKKKTTTTKTITKKEKKKVLSKENPSETVKVALELDENLMSSSELQNAESTQQTSSFTE